VVIAAVLLNVELDLSIAGKFRLTLRSKKLLKVFDWLPSPSGRRAGDEGEQRKGRLVFVLVVLAEHDLS
jgi:hypothetical protein